MEITPDLQVGHLGYKFWVGQETASVLGAQPQARGSHPGKGDGLPPSGSAALSQPQRERAIFSPHLSYPRRQRASVSPSTTMSSGVTMLLGKVLRSKVDRHLAQAHPPRSGGEKLLTQLVWG